MREVQKERQATDTAIRGRPLNSAVTLTILIFVVVACVLAAHWPTLSARALTFDDQDYLIDNVLVRHPSWDSVRRFFGEVLRPSTVEGYYQPLAMTSLMLDYSLTARPDDLRPFHRTSLILHVLNTVLVIVLLYLLFGQPWPAALVGSLFGVHPLVTGTVPWISERKTVLATFFMLWSFVLYVLYVRKPRWPAYAGVLATFVLALLSKPTTTPLPVLLVLLDYWPLRRLSVRTLVEKVPLVAIAAVFGVITYVSQAGSAGVLLPGDYSTWWIPLTLCYNIVFYLYTIVWPADLAVMYPYPMPFDLSQPLVLAGVIGTAVLVVGLVISLRWTRALLTGWLFLFVAIFPTLGVIGFTHVLAADKYAYLPVLGLLLIVAGLLSRVWNSPPAGAVAIWRGGVIVATVLAAGLLVRQTQRQLGHWQSTEALCQHMLKHAPQSAHLHNDLGIELARQGRMSEAIEQYTDAVRIEPRLYRAHNGLGNALLEGGRFPEAVAAFEAALHVKPDYGAAYNGLGTALARQGKLDEALPYFERAVELSPNIADAHANVAGILAKRGELDRAIAQYQEALRLKPEFAAGHNNLGLVLFAKGELETAAAQFREAIRLQNSYVDPYVNLARILMAQGRYNEAAAMYESALRLAPADARARAGLREVQDKRARRK